MKENTIWYNIQNFDNIMLSYDQSQYNVFVTILTQSCFPFMFYSFSKYVLNSKPKKTTCNLFSFRSRFTVRLWHSVLGDCWLQLVIHIIINSLLSLTLTNWPSFHSYVRKMQIIANTNTEVITAEMSNCLRSKRQSSTFNNNYLWIKLQEI